ncbi:hypothetical protein TRM7557_03828 [Tritonibacter multivorans]|uniref:Uncharacterized protein n=2 Tax=Tritonibacter multivorans TaxID=928856 RepID=A0A0P1GJG9_9RHOB|nr:hypothetical protein [Tritonibacter multivorans]MDA7421525.1 hypothetical protein [Tritonibacter multivorans]CUH82243.1 hypothetical protein TRM7557_03828 [Tritonibacter multivorans]SFC96801.1 hypothetical protein SAMN04488049_105174 [Tritonibacter multivorans]
MFKPMKASDLRKCLPRLRQRFPIIQNFDDNLPTDDLDRFIRFMAKKQHITESEARAEVEDFLYLESLHRELDHS